MSMLFDQGTPVPLRWHLTRHVVDTAFERGWSALHSGALLDVAEQEGYNLLMTTDQHVRYRQRLADRQLAIIVLRSTSWPRMPSRIATIQAAVERIVAGDTKKFPSDATVHDWCKSPQVWHGPQRTFFGCPWPSSLWDAAQAGRYATLPNWRGNGGAQH